MDKTGMGIPIYNVKSLDAYWKRLEESLESMISVYLKNKHEYGTSYMCSESGIQIVLAYSARRIAENHGLDANKTMCICMAVGLLFPQYGSVGMAAFENYLKNNNIVLDITELKIGAIESLLYHDSCVITPCLDEALHAYYENRTDISEVNVARYCQSEIKKSRELMKQGVIAPKAISEIMDFSEGCFSTEKSLMADVTHHIDIPIEVQEEINKSLDEWIEYSGQINGIFHFLI